MTNLDLLMLGLRNLWRRKLRTFLTVLGVVIGAASIIIMISFGLAISKSNEEMLSRMGDATTLTVHSDDYFGGFGPMEPQQNTGEKKYLNEQTLNDIANMRHVTAAAPVIEGGGMITYKKMSGYAQIIGIDPQYWEAFGLIPEEGELPAIGDDKSGIVGSWVGDTFYNPSNPRNQPVDLLGQTITWHGSDFIEIDQSPSPFEETTATKTEKPPTRDFKITGKLSQENFEYGTALILPFRQVEEMKKLKDDFTKKMAEQSQDPIYQEPQPSSNPKNKYTKILVKIDAVENVEAAQQELKDMGYMVSGMIDITNELANATQVIQLVLGGIGAISLIVAAIGITNTMVMSIYERTREIGVMKVIGASISNIRNMFLFEAGMIGLLGGAFGVMLSLLASKVINYFGAQFQQGMMGMGTEPTAMSVIPLWLIILALVFSIGIGVISGYYPAVRATRLSALEAMRND